MLYLPQNTISSRETFPWNVFWKRASSFKNKFVVFKTWQIFNELLVILQQWFSLSLCSPVLNKDSSGFSRPIPFTGSKNFSWFLFSRCKLILSAYEMKCVYLSNKYLKSMYCSLSVEWKLWWKICTCFIEHLLRNSSSVLDGNELSHS